MRLAEIVVDVPASARGVAERAAYASGAQGLEVRDADTGATNGRVQVVWWAPEGVRHAIARAVRSQLDSVRGARVATRLVDAAWMKPPRPRNLGARFVVVGPDESRGRIRGRIALPIEASLGFGDGLHPTTALCVEAMERRAMPARVLDVGTGTGVLSIVASKLGAETIVATDVDPLALHAARDNLARNGVQARLSRALPRGRFDLVIANVYFEPLLGLLPELSRRADTLILSGFGVGSTPKIVDALPGFACERPRTRQGFACLTATRRPTRPR